MTTTTSEMISNFHIFFWDRVLRVSNYQLSLWIFAGKLKLDTTEARTH